MEAIVRLWLRLFIAIAVLVLAALGVLLIAQQNSFRRGLLDYVNELQRRRLPVVAEALAKRYAEAGDWEFLRDNPLRFALIVRLALGVDPRAVPGAPFDGGVQPPPPREPRLPPPDFDRFGRPFDPARPRPRPPAAPPPADAFDPIARLQLLDAQQRPVVGRQPEGASLDLPIEWSGQRVGYLRLAALPRLQEDVDLGFAADQLRTALVAGALVLAAALLMSLALSRWLLRPLHGLRHATSRLAAGVFEVRLPRRGGSEFVELAEDFNQLAETLSRNRDARNRWIADLSHELRTPLAILRGELQAIEDGVRPLDAAAIRSLQGETERLERLVNDLYQLALSDAGALAYRFEWTDLGEWLTDIAASQQARFAREGIELRCSVSASAASVRVDPDRLAQLVVNLLNNSLRYTDAPGHVELRLESDAKHVRICVDDSAPGVPSEALPRLFERLFRVEASRNRGAGGAGLGLAICRNIAQAHGGSLIATASALGGLRVVLELPRKGVLP